MVRAGIAPLVFLAFMRRRQFRLLRAARWHGGILMLVLAGLFVPAAGAASQRRSTSGPSGLCELIDHLIPVDCGGDRPAQSAPSAATSGTPASEDDQVRRTPAVVRYDPRRLAVTARPASSRPAIEAAFARAGVTVELAIPAIDAYMVGVDPGRRDSALASLRRSGALASAGQEVLVDALATNPNDSAWAQQWGLRLTGMPEAWELAPASNNVLVAVVDTGVDPSQPDLQGALVPGYDFLDGTTTPTDDQGHGTAVAGIIAARTNNQVGIAGVCGNCLIMPIKVLDENGVGDDSVIAAGIVWAADHGAKVINLSLGGPGATPELSAAIAYALGKGALVIAAAGNDATSTPFYPAADPKAISVAGTTSVDQPYPWTDFGSWVKLAAPGCNLAPLLAGGYGSFCGTSSAAPIVAGLAALAFAANPAATAEQIEQALEHPAVPLSSLVQYGRINAPASLALISRVPAAKASAPAPEVRQRRPRHRQARASCRAWAKSGRGDSQELVAPNR